MAGGARLSPRDERHLRKLFDAALSKRRILRFALARLWIISEEGVQTAEDVLDCSEIAMPDFGHVVRLGIVEKKAKE